MGHGGAQTLLARDEHDPDAPLVRPKVLQRIVRTYERTAYHLQVLTLADADGRRQSLRVTDEHPFYRTAPAAGGSAGVPGSTPARSLAAGDEVLGDCGVLTVIANAREAHRQGVKVYNLEVEQAHTYFVLAEHAPDGADAVWVHNADPHYASSSFRSEPHAAAKAAAAKTADGQMICPTWVKVIPETITVQTKYGPVVQRGYQLDHFPHIIWRGSQLQANDTSRNLIRNIVVRGKWRG
jgi:hypothetical protein